MKTLKNTEVLCAVASGEVLPLSRMPDEAFSSGLLGVGYAIEPSEGNFYAPANGKVTSVSETGHAYTVLTDAGVDILVHIGVDTVTLGGRGFTPLVKEGARVRAGDALCRADLDLIREKGLPTMSAVLVTEADAIGAIEFRYGTVRAKDADVMKFERREG